MNNKQRIRSRDMASAEQKRWKSIKILLSLACGCFAYWVFTTAAWPYLMTMTHGALETNPLLFIAATAVVVLCAVVLLYRDLDIFRTGISKRFGDAQAIAYGALLLVAVMSKSVGTRGINWDITAIVDELSPISPTLILNILLFIPAGMMMSKMLCKTPWRHILVLVVLISIELLQYLLSLGICDINDVLENYSGILCGTITAAWLRAHVCTLCRINGCYMIRQAESAKTLSPQHHD